MIEIEIPIKIESEANKREHWRKQANRTKKHRRLAEVLTKSAMLKVDDFPLAPVVVKFIRVGKRRLDDDNLAGGFKAVRDGVCDALGIDDGSEVMRFHYGQTVGKEYSARVYVC